MKAASKVQVYCLTQFYNNATSPQNNNNNFKKKKKKTTNIQTNKTKQKKNTQKVHLRFIEKQQNILCMIGLLSCLFSTPLDVIFNWNRYRIGKLYRFICQSPLQSIHDPTLLLYEYHIVVIDFKGNIRTYAMLSYHSFKRGIFMPHRKPLNNCVQTKGEVDFKLGPITFSSTQYFGTRINSD